MAEEATAVAAVIAVCEEASAAIDALHAAADAHQTVFDAVDGLAGDIEWASKLFSTDDRITAARDMARSAATFDRRVIEYVAAVKALAVMSRRVRNLATSYVTELEDAEGG